MGNVDDGAAGKDESISMTVEKFIAANQFDFRSARALRSLTEEQGRFVLKFGFQVNPDNKKVSASALVTARCRLAKEKCPSPDDADAEGATDGKAKSNLPPKDWAEQ